MKKVSMVVPCYNKVQYIGEFFQSVYDQVWDNIELILVNDGSTDGTREIIGQWEDRFIARGYSVRIVDQENKGVSAAVKAGLECVTGDFFCCPDCDDVLHPEYVSKMAQILIEDESVARVVCDLSAEEYITGNRKGLSARLCLEPTRLEIDLLCAAMLRRISYSICGCMVRSLYLRQVIEAYGVDLRESQEGQSAVIYGYIGNTVYLPEILYFYRHPLSEARPRNKNYVALRDHYYNIFDTLMNVANQLPASESLRNKWRFCNQFGRAHTAAQMAVFYREQEEISSLDEMRAAAENMDIPLKYKIGSIANKRWLALGRAISNYIVGFKNPFHVGHYTSNRRGRIIGYAAYGIAAGDMLSLVVDSPLRPDVLWDRAEGASEVMGIPVERPDIDSLTPNDMVLVFIRIRKTAAEVCDLLESSRTDNILYYYDVLDYLADFYFPLKEETEE